MKERRAPSVGMGSAGGSVFGLLIGLAALVASMWFSLAQGVKRLHDLDTVSYTHLDVYKRQTYNSTYFIDFVS